MLFIGAGVTALVVSLSHPPKPPEVKPPSTVPSTSDSSAITTNSTSIGTSGDTSPSATAAPTGSPPPTGSPAPALQGVIYAIKPDGRLYWYRHNDPAGGAPGFANGGGGKQIGVGWNGYANVFSGGGGI